VRRGTIISSFKKAPKGFLVVLALFLATEITLYVNRPYLVKDFWNKFLINEHELIDMRIDYDYLIMGDSLQKTGINPSVISEKVLNLGLTEAKPIKQYILLKRYLEKHKPPKAIFLHVDPEEPKDTLLVILSYFASVPEFLHLFKDLTWRERGYFFLRYWVSLDTRHVSLTRRSRYAYGNDVFVRQMKKNQGYMPSPSAGESIDNDYFARTRQRYRTDISVTKRDMRYLDKLVELASSSDIDIVFIGIVLPEELYDILLVSGFNERYLSFVKDLKRRYPDTYFTKNPILFLENKYFGDMSHVNNKGCGLYTTHFKNQILIPMEAIHDKKMQEMPNP